ncbi:putative bifunctional diguanylate cyclase/phosphodiesterase [Massilia niastensis]|uniref:putative bifunctional diguanylate cyclase/phosphodiesterase n=1 Tax=Massilia niastensis TaxID=544911 RepID=UPI00037EC68C|nr:EAL domain-containing protein [Massilia niastensis]
MEQPRIPTDEAQRLAALHATNLLGSSPEESFDRITRMASRLLGMPMSVISLVDRGNQWFKSRCGLKETSTGRDVSFCGHAILSDEPLVVPDAANDPRFSDNPLVTGGPRVRFYAGVQLYSVDRMKLGTLCVMDRLPHRISEADLDTLRDLARMVEQLIYHRQLAMAARALHEQLTSSAARGQLSPAAGQVEFLLNHDVLTGLANRHALVRAIQDGIVGWRDRAASAVVACLNLDRFKRLNELLGHRAGDEALVAITRSLQDRLREDDMLARAGNDEFVLLLNDAGDDRQARDLLERLLRAVNRQIIADGTEISLTCSIGYARFPDDGEDADALLNNAVLAMRHAKTMGGGTIQPFSKDLRQELGRRLTLESHLRRAAEAGELFLQYQPKIDLRHGRIAGFEALLRWQHPEYGVLSPDEFVPIAEETGLTVPIGEWAMRTVAAQVAAWRDEGLPAIPVAVNLSARQFLQTDVVATVQELLRTARIEPGLLELELTESVSMADPVRSEIVMRRLRELGVTLSIDDFGTGYSSFAYLKRLPIDKLKIDRSFILDMTQSAESLAIVQAMIAMAHRLHLVVVAEGVETAEQVAALRKAECDQIQGYFFSRPLRANDCGAYIREHAMRGARP